MRIMGLDVGSKTVGVAVSDPMGWTAQGVEIVRISEIDEEYGYDRILELIKEHEVTKVVELYAEKKTSILSSKIVRWCI